MIDYTINTSIDSFDIILVHTKNKELSKDIQAFQKLEDKEAGKYNHSMVTLWIGEYLYVVEADFLKKGNKRAKLQAAVILNPFSDYLKKLDNNEVELLLLKNDKHINYNQGVRTLLEMEGTVYDYKNFFSQIYRTIRKALNKNYKPKPVTNGDDGYICHELTQRFFNKTLGWFNEWDTANVAPIYNSKKFKHINIEITKKNERNNR